MCNVNLLFLEIYIRIKINGHHQFLPKVIGEGDKGMCAYKGTRTASNIELCFSLAFVQYIIAFLLL